MNHFTVTDSDFAAQTRLAVAARVLSEMNASQALPQLAAHAVVDALAETTRIRAARAEVLRDEVALRPGSALRSCIEERSPAHRLLAGELGGR